jgi:hypothetical protein
VGGAATGWQWSAARDPNHNRDDPDNNNDHDNGYDSRNRQNLLSRERQALDRDIRSLIDR